MTLLDRVFGRGVDAAVRELSSEASAAAPSLAPLFVVDQPHATAAALLLAKLCFDRAVGKRHGGHPPLGLVTRASALLYPAIATALGVDSAQAGQRYVDFADAVRRRFESRAPATAGAEIVADELRRIVAPDVVDGAISPELTMRVDALIKAFDAILSRKLSLFSTPATRPGGAPHGS